MCLALGNLLVGGFANIHNLYIKVEVFAGQGMVHIHIHIESADLYDGARLNAIISVDMNVFARSKPALMLEVLAGNALGIIYIAQPVTLGRHD